MSRQNTGMLTFLILARALILVHGDQCTLAATKGYKSQRVLHNIDEKKGNQLLS